jgi:hypothetical protein
VVATAPEPGIEGAREVLGRQTDAGYSLAAWARDTSGELVLADSSGTVRRTGQATSVEELLEVLDADFLVDASHLRQPLRATWIESVRWVLAAEHVRLLELRGDPDVVVAARDLWCPEGVSRRALEGLVRGRFRHVVGASVAGVKDPPAGSPSSALAREHRQLLRQVGPWLVPRSIRREVLDHELRLPRVATGQSDDRPPVALVVVSAPLVAGLEQVVSTLVRTLAESLHPVVVAAPVYDGMNERRLEVLEAVTPHVYPMGTLLAEPLWAPLLERLVRVHGATTLVHIGDRSWWSTTGLRDTVPGLRMVAVPTRSATLSAAPIDADTWVALDSQRARQLEARGVPSDHLVELPAVWSLPRPAAACDGDRLRAGLGMGEGDRLVAMAADLVAATRPEDLIAVARRFVEDRHVWFVLEGEGPLAVSLAEQARMLALERFLLTRPERTPGELEAAADVVCCPGEAEIVDRSVVHGLAAGRPVVAARTAAMAGPAEHCDGDRLRLVPRGDLDALEQGLRTALGAGPLPPADELVAWLRHQAETAVSRLRRAVGPRPE